MQKAKKNTFRQKPKIGMKCAKNELFSLFYYQIRKIFAFYSWGRAGSAKINLRTTWELQRRKCEAIATEPQQPCNNYMVLV